MSCNAVLIDLMVPNSPADLTYRSKVVGRASHWAREFGHQFGLRGSRPDCWPVGAGLFLLVLGRAHAPREREKDSVQVLRSVAHRVQRRELPEHDRAPGRRRMGESSPTSQRKRARRNLESSLHRQGIVSSER